MGDPDIQEALPAGMVALRLEKYSEHTGKWYQLEPIVQYRGIKT
jgi:hypothetical protein